jgi:hypothetical protein
MPARNPYSTGAAFPDMSPTINSFVDNLVRLKTHQEDIDMRGEALKETRRGNNLTAFGTEQPGTGPTLQSREMTVREGTRSLAEKTQRDTAAQIPDHKQVLNPSEVVAKKILVKTTFGDGALKVLAPIFTTIDEVAAANPNTTKWDAYTGVKDSWAGQRDEVIGNAEKYMMSPEYEKLKPAQKEAFTKLFNGMKFDTTGDIIYDKGLFKNTVASKKAEDQAAAAKMGKDDWIQIEGQNGPEYARASGDLTGKKPYIEPKVTRPSSVAPGGTLVDDSGKVVYTNPNRPESSRPVSVAPGGTLVNPTTGTEIYKAPNKPDKGTTETELRAQRKELADNESKLLLNRKGPEGGPLADLHNERSEKPYAYQWKPVSGVNSLNPWGSDGEYVQVKLPKIKGKQVTAKDVYDTASQRGMTYDEVLQAIGVK